MSAPSYSRRPAAPVALRELVKAAPSTPRVCSGCGRTHYPGRRSRRALECLLNEAHRLTMAIKGFSRLVDEGKTPTLDVVLQTMQDCAHLCEGISEHATAELSELGPLENKR